MPFSRKKPEIQVGLSGTALKYIAMATMLADHIELCCWNGLYTTGEPGTGRHAP